MKRLETYADYAYPLLRIVAGLMFSGHGAQKLFGLFAGTKATVGSQLWFAGIIELVGGLAIALGLGTRVAAFFACGEMALAYLQIHWKFQLGSHFFPIMNKGELSLLYCFLFLFVFFRGGGKWSLTRRI